MSDMLFDLSFEGTLAADADPAVVRQHLAALFKLDAAGVARLFSGQPVVVKRAVDGATAARFELAFHQAGAVLLLTPTPTEPAAVAPAPPPAAIVVADNPRFIAAPDVLEVLPQDGFIEQEAVVKMPALDTSYLSLVTAADWSLADCQLPVAPAPVADFSHLSLAALDPTSTRKDNEL
ncbi:hypothetical protein CKO12_01625 [Chromatium okenii]|uniref:hypothetical protein n=1 Tax=Chromatium okenii TaxID=61644 RepID=UPI0019047C57|nr:hypothetical protein [Chromatium okenii]MBK1640597.1 hypothetical protein [Chromatium okenii]